MRKGFFCVAALAAGMALPAVASATHTGTDCSYAYSHEYSEDVSPNGPGGPTVVVYADTDGGAGTTGTADVAAGVCADNLGIGGGPAARLDGGTVEVGAGQDPATGSNDPEPTPDAYAVIDGSNHNNDPTGSDQSEGHVGLSNYETGEKEDCPNPAPYDDGTGTNSGDCLSVRTTPLTDPIVSVPVPLVICGNTTGKNWDDSERDGCTAV